MNYTENARKQLAIAITNLVRFVIKEGVITDNTTEQIYRLAESYDLLSRSSPVYGNEEKE